MVQEDTAVVDHLLIPWLQAVSDEAAEQRLTQLIADEVLRWQLQ